MRHPIRTTALALLAVLAFPALLLAADPFQGKWNVTVTPDDDAAGNGQKEFKDVLAFQADQFVAEAQAKNRGFKSVAYEADTRRGPTATFKAEAKSEKEGAMKWSGFTTGSEIQGELVWTQKDGSELRYTFKGTKQ